MKTKISVVSIVCLSMLLVGCTSDDIDKQTTTEPFVSQELTILPYWELGEITHGAWDESDKALEEPLIDEATGEPIVPSSATVLSKETLAFSNDKGCTITGTVTYTDSYKESRGDEFNSKDYLYNLVAPTSDTVANESHISINGTDYVYGEFSNPIEWGENQHHRTAVRVFSTALEIENMSELGEDVFSPHNSDATKGLPVAMIDFSCATKSDLTDELWDKGITYFKLKFEESAPIDPKDYEDQFDDSHIPASEGAYNPAPTEP